MAVSFVGLSYYGSRNELLSHVNIILHQFQNLFRVVTEFLAEVGIVEVGEEFDHVVDDVLCSGCPLYPADSFR